MNTTRTMVLALALGLVVHAALAQTPAPPCEMRVATDPPGATISCDGIPGDLSPLLLADLAPGRHLVLARKTGFELERRTVELRPGQRVALDLVLRPVYALLLVHSTPKGAEVEIDGAVRGNTPLLVTDLPVGKYRMRLSHPGYRSMEVEFSAPDRTPIRIEETLTSDMARLVLDSEPPGASVLLNGASTGQTTPCTIDRIPSGTAVVRMTVQGYKPFDRELALVAGEEYEVNAVLDPEPATLKVVTIPDGARIYVDNQFRGESPLTLENLAPGTYRVRAEARGCDPDAREVVVGAASDRVEEFRLARNSGSMEITTEPAGVRILVDGEHVGTTTAPEEETDRLSLPLEADLLSAGGHTVRLVKAGYFDKEFTIEVRKDETVTLHHRMERRFIPNFEVVTDKRVIRGVLILVDPKGNVKIEVKPGVIKTIPKEEI
ncbi:MAG: PEGA domain-containing protein, partial [Lentisphaerae bacterium]|nr:PEGA domain-containing protein [Lentisphaerota bacterium]